MQQHMQRQPAQAPVPAATTPEEARQLAESLMEVMTTLLSTLERETELVRAGKIREAMAIQPTKVDLSRRYVQLMMRLKTSRQYLQESAPDLLAALHRHHDVFRPMLKVNLTVLATAHAVSENVVRGVNREMQRRTMPSTYTASGRRAMPGPRNTAPFAVSRSL
jgi:hypothetical protein